MASSSHLAGVALLSVEEKVRLVEELWDSIAEQAEMLPLEEWHKATLESRLIDQSKAPGAATSWQDLKAKLLAHPQTMSS